MNKKEEDNYKSYSKLSSEPSYQQAPRGDNGDPGFDQSMGFVKNSNNFKVAMHQSTTSGNSKGHDSLIDTLIQNMHSTNERQKKLEDEHREALEALNQKQEELRKFETLKASTWLDSQLQPPSTVVDALIIANAGDNKTITSATSQQLGDPSVLPSTSTPPSRMSSISIAPPATNHVASTLSTATTTTTTDLANICDASATTKVATSTTPSVISTTTVIAQSATTTRLGTNGSGAIYVTRLDFVPPPTLTQPPSPHLPYMAVGVGEFLFALPPTENTGQIVSPDASYFEKVSNGDRGLVPMTHVEPVAVSLLTDYFKLCNLLYLTGSTANPDPSITTNSRDNNLSRKGARSRLSHRSISQDHTHVTCSSPLPPRLMGADETSLTAMTNASTAPDTCGGPGCESPFDLYDTELMDSLVAQTLSPSFRVQTIVPHPYGLMIEKQLKRSLLVSWCRPTELPANAVTGYQIILDGQIRAVTKRGQRTRALIEDIDFFKTHRISVRSLTPVGHSHDAFCTLTIGRDSTMAPTRVRVGNVTKCSALVFWLASDTNISHSVFVNNIEVKTLRPGILMHKLNGLSPSTSYRVKVKAVPGSRGELKDEISCNNKRRPASAIGHSLTTQQRRGASLEDITSLPADRLHADPSVGEDRLLFAHTNLCAGHRTLANLTSATLEFKTLPGKIPEAPKDLVIEPGPQDGTFLLTWLPIPVDKTGLNDNSLIITGYAVYFDGRKVAEVSSPSGDHVLLDMEVFLESIPTFITVRTLSGELQSRDSLPAKFVERPEPEDDKTRFPADGLTSFPSGDMDISQDRGDQGPYLDYNNAYMDAPLPYSDREIDSRQQIFPHSTAYGIQSQIYQRIKAQNLHGQQLCNGPPRDGYGGIPTSDYVKSELAKRSTEIPYYNNLPLTSYDSSYPQPNHVWPYSRGPQLNGAARYQGFNDVYYDVPNARTRLTSPEMSAPYSNIDSRRETLPEQSNAHAQGRPLQMPVAYNYPSKGTGRDLPHGYDPQNDHDNRHKYYREEGRRHDVARPPPQSIAAPDLGGAHEKYYPPPFAHSGRDKYAKEEQQRLASTAPTQGRKTGAAEPVVVEAAFDYDPAYMSPNDADAAKEELAFRTGDRIQVLSGLDPDGFFVGRRLDFASGGRGAVFAEGLVPSNMVNGPIAPSPRDIAAIRSARKVNAIQPRDSHHHTIPRSNNEDDNGGHKARAIPAPTGLTTASDTDASAGSSYRPQRKSSLQTMTDQDLEELKVVQDSRGGSYKREKQAKSSKNATGSMLDHIEPQMTLSRTPSYVKTTTARGEETVEQSKVPDQRRSSGQEMSPRRLTRTRSSKNDQSIFHPDDPNSPEDLKNASFRPLKQQREIVREPDKDYHQTHNEWKELGKRQDEEPTTHQDNTQNSQYLNPVPPQAIMKKRESATGLPINPATARPSGPTKRMIALFDYDPRILSPNVDSDLELSFKTGDIILVEGEMDPDGFYIGRLGNMQGLVPSNFLKELPPLPEEDPSFYDLPTVQKKAQKSKGLSGEDIKAKGSTENIPNKSRRPISGSQSAQSSPRTAAKGGNTGNSSASRNVNNVGQSGHSNLAVNDSHGQNESGFFSHLLKFTPKTG